MITPARLFLLLLSVAMFMGSTGLAQEWLAYDAEAFKGGQWWRALSSWVTQLNLRHWLLNQWGLIAMWLLLPAHVRRSTWIGLTFVWLVASLCLSLSDYDNYVGLSGLLYGWLVVSAAHSPFYELRVKAIFIGVLSVKVISENLGIAGLEESWVGDFISATVAHESHFWGWMAGIVFILGQQIFQRFLSKPMPRD